ncbi:YdbH domain-containing protein [Psychromonas antarctica]|uniref:YdbH domain-containing protein n=1 Tax=Psychromonas antarctica TaxID=67573 RepID=UPI001EE8F750|nr:YdbH domain-containing protein [Psychromonas antarctica]
MGKVNLLGKLNRYLVILASCLMLLNSVTVAAAQLPDKSLLAWLPVLTSNIKLLQPNLNCPQNQITNIQVNKKENQVKVDIAAINWDFNCGKVQTLENPVENNLSSVIKNKQIGSQFNALFDFSPRLPDTTITIKSLTLTSAFIKNKFISSLLIKKTQQALMFTLKSEGVNAKLTIKLSDKSFMLESAFSLAKIAHLIDLPIELKNNTAEDLSLHYASDLNAWWKGVFSINWQGVLGDLTEQGKMSAEGEIDLLKNQLKLNQLAGDLQNITYKISAQQHWKTNSVRLKLVQPAIINLATMEISSLPLTLHIGNSALQTKVLRGKAQRIRVDTQKLPAVLLTVTAKGRPLAFSLDWRLSSLEQILTGSIVSAGKIIKLTIPSSPLSAQTLVSSLQSYLPILEPLQVEAGNINLQLAVLYDSSNNSGQLKSTLIIDKLAGEYNNVLFDGITGNSELDYRFEKGRITINQDQQQLKIENLFIGIPIQALQFDGRLNAFKPVIDHLKARLLDGRIDVDDLKLTPPSQTVINISAISLSEVIRYSAYPEIQSSAIMDGALPLYLSDQGASIKAGVVFARPPGGYIKVPENTVIEAMGKGNPALAYTLQLLSNFQFDTLQGDIGYTPEGDANLKIKIKGISPNISGIHPINFNYSHQENILKLLKSLRFDEQLLEQIKERY